MCWKCSFVCVCLHLVSTLCCEYYKWNPLTSSNEHIAGLILARGGSKGIPLKNIAKIGDRTLLQISIAVLKDVKGLSSIWVSTDHILIAEEADKENINIHWRSSESASDNATSIFAVQEFLKNHRYIDVVCLVQCTSPFLKVHYLQKAINWIRSKEECVFSVSRSYKLRWREVDGKLIPINFNIKKRPRRQDFNGELVENGGVNLLAIYCYNNVLLGDLLLLQKKQSIGQYEFITIRAGYEYSKSIQYMSTEYFIEKRTLDTLDSEYSCQKVFES